MAITRVWIEEGCISCGLSESNCPEVFKVNTISAAITAALANGAPLPEAVQIGKDFVTEALRNAFCWDRGAAEPLVALNQANLPASAARR